MKLHYENVIETKLLTKYIIAVEIVESNWLRWVGPVVRMEQKKYVNCFKF
jgi:hypothetical protein